MHMGKTYNTKAGKACLSNLCGLRDGGGPFDPSGCGWTLWNFFRGSCLAPCLLELFPLQKSSSLLGGEGGMEGGTKEKREGEREGEGGRATERGRGRKELPHEIEPILQQNSHLGSVHHGIVTDHRRLTW